MRGDGWSSASPGIQLQGHPQLSLHLWGLSSVINPLIAHGMRPCLTAPRYPILLVPRAFSLEWLQRGFAFVHTHKISF